ncbi:MAG TPA: hypothetical protein VIW24_10410 [Aldersonia sp.]
MSTSIERARGLTAGPDNGGGQLAVAGRDGIVDGQRVKRPFLWRQSPQVLRAGCGIARDQDTEVQVPPGSRA